MTPDQGWREIHRTTDPRLAQVVATSIAAMEFDVRARDTSSGVVLGEDSHLLTGPFVVEVAQGDAEALREVVDEIIDEQEAFDTTLDRRERRASYARRMVILGLAGLIAVLVVLRLIDL